MSEALIVIFWKRVASYSHRLSLVVCTCTGVVSSKTVCFLSSAEVSHINHCLVKGFIYSFPDTSMETNVSLSRDCQQQQPSTAACDTCQLSTVSSQRSSSCCECDIASLSVCDVEHTAASCRSSSDTSELLEIENINILTVPVIHVNEFFFFTLLSVRCSL